MYSDNGVQRRSNRIEFNLLNVSERNMKGFVGSVLYKETTLVGRTADTNPYLVDIGRETFIVKVNGVIHIGKGVCNLQGRNLKGLRT